MTNVSETLSNATIDVGSNNNYNVTGSNNQSTVGTASILTATGLSNIIAVTGTGDSISAVGVMLPSTTTAAYGDTITFANGGTFTAAGAIYATVTGNNLAASVYSVSTLILQGQGDSVSSMTSGNTVAIGQNGQTATGVNIDSVDFGVFGGTLNELAGSNVSVTGQLINIAMASDDTLTATGVGIVIQANGVNDVVTVGGNPQLPGLPSDNKITFAHAGQMKETSNSRADVYGDNVTATIAADDIVGLYGSGDSINATGADDQVWLGLNGQLASGAAVDTIHFAAGGYLHEMGGSNVALTGSNVNVALNDWDTLTASGSAIHFAGSGPGEIVTIGGDGSAASNANEDTGTFANGGTLNVLANSRVDVSGNGVAAHLAADDTLGLYGSNNSVTSSSAGDRVWIGQNGQNATGAALDNVDLSAGGRVVEMSSSNIAVKGSHIVVAVNDSDTLTATGSAIKFVASGQGDIVNIGGDGQFASNADEDIGGFAKGGTLNLLAYSRADVNGSQVNATLAGDDTLGLYGSGDTVTSSSKGDAVWIGGNGLNATGASIDSVSLTAGGRVVEMANSNIAVDGANVTVVMNDHDMLTLTMSNSPAAPDRVLLGADDCLTISSSNTNPLAPWVSIQLTGTAGQDVITGFAAGAALSLHSKFADAAALLAATTFAGGAATIHLDNSGDSLTLMGVNQVTFISEVNSGQIKI